jgi:hypothetical protein
MERNRTVNNAWNPDAHLFIALINVLIDILSMLQSALHVKVWSRFYLNRMRVMVILLRI